MAFFRSPDRLSGLHESLEGNLSYIGGSDLCAAFDNLGMRQWYERVAQPLFCRDPWDQFREARKAAAPRSECLRTLLDLFILDQAVSRSRLFASIGPSLTSWLHSRDVIRHVGDGKIQSNFCLLYCFGYYVFIDWPIETPSGRLVSVDTYLGSSSMDCVQSVLERQECGRSLEFGCGSGIVALPLARRSRFPVVVDIDPRATKLTRLNLCINDVRAEIVECDFGGAFSHRARFDFIIVNPPWRIVPPGVAYPNPTARVGLGSDGLGYVRKIFDVLPTLLAPEGEAIIRVDVPIRAHGSHVLQHQMDRLRRDDCSAELIHLGEIPVDCQAEISADTCSHLNFDSQNLKQCFLSYYSVLGICALEQVRLVIRKESSAIKAISSRFSSCRF